MESECHFLLRDYQQGLFGILSSKASGRAPILHLHVDWGTLSKKH